MNRNNNSVKSLVYWLLVAWVTVAIAVNPKPLVDVDIELNNGVPTSYSVTADNRLAGGHASPGGS